MMKWVVRREDVNYHDVHILGIFTDLDSATMFVKNSIIENIKANEDAYDQWTIENKNGTMNEYIYHTIKELDDVIDEWKKTLDTPFPKFNSNQWEQKKDLIKSREGFYWGMGKYIFTQVREY